MTALRNDGMFSNINQPMILSKSKAVEHTLKLDICLISEDIQFTLMDFAYSSNRNRFVAATLQSESTMCITRALLGSTLPYTVVRLVESSVEIITLTNVFLRNALHKIDQSPASLLISLVKRIRRNSLTVVWLL